MGGSVSKVKHVLRNEGFGSGVLRLSRQLGVTSLENNALRLANRMGASTIEDYILYRRWGFDKSGRGYEAQIVNVDPDEIRYTEFFPFDVRGENAVVGEGGGPWYRCVQRFDKYQLYQAMRAHFVEGKKWEKTEMYRDGIERIERGEKAWNNCTTPAELRERCEYIDELYANIRDNGYQSQEDLYVNSHQRRSCYARTVNGARFPDELRLAVGPAGRLIRVEGGRHRLSIAKILGIEEIPATIQIVHEDCPAKVRAEILRSDTGETGISNEQKRTRGSVHANNRADAKESLN